MKIIIVGSGFASLSAATYLARDGHEIVVLEKNSTLGGRARQLKREGFTFDIGPSWYWMPDVFQRYFSDFGKSPSDYYHLEKLDPAYKLYFSQGESVTIPGEYPGIRSVFEDIEPGSGDHLDKFMALAEDNYNIAIKDLVYRPGLSPLELITPKTATKLKQFVSTIKSQARKHIQNHKLRSILEFPVLFLGAKPSNTPGFYNFMNYADFKLGTWYPKGGMYSVVEGMVRLASEQGVRFITDCNVEKIVASHGLVSSLETSKGPFDADLVVSGADYHHSESLLESQYRNYSENYWRQKTFAPSSLLFFIGIKKKLKNICHHTLFFDSDFDQHAAQIYDQPSWPEKPMFYGSFPSATDPSVAPKGMDAAIFLIPIAPDLEDTPEIRDKYFEMIMQRFEKLTVNTIREDIIFKESYCVEDFKSDYNSYKGNAYGLANTLLQTAFLRPKLKNKKLPNLFYTGQLTVPGPGVPPSLISGKIVSDLVMKYIKTNAA